MKLKRFYCLVCIVLAALLCVGCAGPTGEDIMGGTAVPPTATSIPPTETAVPTNTPIPPTATPEPTPTPINYVAVVEEFVAALNQGEDVSDYLADDTAVIVEGDAPIFVETMADFVAYSQGAGSQFTVENCQVKATAVACEATVTNEWLPIIQEEISEWEGPLVYNQFHFTMTDEGRIASLTLEMDEETAANLSNLYILFVDWMIVNDIRGTEELFNKDLQLVYNEQHGKNLADWAQTYVDLMVQVFELYYVSEEAYQAGDYETAVAHYTDILALNPPSILQYAVIVARADAYDNLGDYEAAIVDYETAVATQNDDPAILNNLCWDYAITEQPELALPYCYQSIALEPAPSSMDSRGVAYGLLGNYEAAIADFEFVVADLENSSSPELAAIREQRADWIVQMQNGQNPFTPTIMAELRGEEPPPPPPTTNTGSDTATTSATAQDYYNLGESYAQQQQWTSAIDAYSQAIALAPQNPYYYSARGFVYGMANDVSNMLADFDQAIALGTQDGVVYFFRGMFYAVEGNNEQAISYVETGMSLGLPPDLQAQAEALLNDLK
ncbi:MAG: tetratricopeptide repeat protein [Ardenticatenaceae bacterium]|nr:tetratricopeptide repeat protein [Ardenticatenaceae bacterium]